MNEKNVYSVLKYIQQVGKGKFKYEDLTLNSEEVNEILAYLDNRKLIDGAGYADDIPYFLINMQITEKGEKYLSENSKLGKAIHIIKTAKETLPGL